jgi:transcriptional regulator with XRE-family HTH domain
VCGDLDDVPPPTPVVCDLLAARMGFARRVKFARVARRLTQDALGERLGIHQSNISTIERGVQGATLSMVWAFSEALNVPVEWLLGTGAEIEPWEA